MRKIIFFILSLICLSHQITFSMSYLQSAKAKISRWYKSNQHMTREEYLQYFGEKVGHVDQRVDTTCIVENASHDISLKANEENKRDKSIFSFFFGGCTGIGIYVLLHNDEQRACLTHYNPGRTQKHIQVIESLCNTLKIEEQRACLINSHPIDTEDYVGLIRSLRNKDSGTIKAVAAIMMHETSYQSKNGIEIPQDSQLLERLATPIKKAFPDKNVTMYHELYSRNEDDNTCHPYGMFGTLKVPKEFEIVLAKSPQDSYFHSKATSHKKQYFSQAKS